MFESRFFFCFFLIINSCIEEIALIDAVVALSIWGIDFIMWASQFFGCLPEGLNDLPHWGLVSDGVVDWKRRLGEGIIDQERGTRFSATHYGRLVEFIMTRRLTKLAIQLIPQSQLHQRRTIHCSSICKCLILSLYTIFQGIQMSTTFLFKHSNKFI